MIMMYCKPPIDYTGRGPDRSMNTHCSDQVEQEYVVFRIGNRFPFAIKHPKYGNSSPANVIPSCLAVSTRKRAWSCAYDGCKSLISIVVSGNSAPGAITAATTGGTGHHIHSSSVTHHYLSSHRGVDREQFQTNIRDVSDVMESRVYVLCGVEFELIETLNTHACHVSYNHNIPWLSKHTVKHITRIASYMNTRPTISNLNLTTRGTRYNRTLCGTLA